MFCIGKMASFYGESIYPPNPLQVRIISSSHIQNKHGETRLAAKLGRYYAMPGQMPVKGGVALSLSGRGGRMFNSWAYKEILERFQSGYLVIVMLGDNDARSMDCDAHSKVLRDWIENFKEFGNHVKGIEFEKDEPGWIVLMGLPIILGEHRTTVSDGVSEINVAMSDLAREVPDRVGFVNTQARIWNLSGLFREDNVHFTEKGEDAMFDLINKIIDVVGRMRGTDITLKDLMIFREY